MAKMREVLVINPNDESIEKTVIDVDDLKAMYRIIQCEMVSMIRAFDGAHGLFLDDNGLYKPNQRFFRIPTHEQPLAGISVLTGLNGFGDISNCRLDFNDVKQDVKFLPSSVKFTGIETIIHDDVKLPEFGGERGVMIEGKPHFIDEAEGLEDGKGE